MAWVKEVDAYVAWRAEADAYINSLNRVRDSVIERFTATFDVLAELLPKERIVEALLDIVPLYCRRYGVFSASIAVQSLIDRGIAGGSRWLEAGIAELELMDGFIQRIEETRPLILDGHIGLAKEKLRTVVFDYVHQMANKTSLWNGIRYNELLLNRVYELTPDRGNRSTLYQRLEKTPYRIKLKHGFVHTA